MNLVYIIPIINILQWLFYGGNALRNYAVFHNTTVSAFCPFSYASWYISD